MSYRTQNRHPWRSDTDAPSSSPTSSRRRESRPWRDDATAASSFGATDVDQLLLSQAQEDVLGGGGGKSDTTTTVTTTAASTNDVDNGFYAMKTPPSLSEARRQQQQQQQQVYQPIHANSPSLLNSNDNANYEDSSRKTPTRRRGGGSGASSSSSSVADMSLGNYWKIKARQQMLIFEEQQKQMRELHEQNLQAAAETSSQAVENYRKSIGISTSSAFENSTSSSTTMSSRARPRPNGSPNDESSNREYLQVGNVTTAANGTSGTTTTPHSFQQYRQQQRVRKHPWRNDVGSSRRSSATIGGKSKRNKKAWKKFVATGRDVSGGRGRGGNAVVTRPWDEPADVTTIQEVDEEQFEQDSDDDSDNTMEDNDANDDDDNATRTSQRSKGSRTSQRSWGSSPIRKSSSFTRDVATAAATATAGAVVSEGEEETASSSDEKDKNNVRSLKRTNSKGDSSDDGNQSVDLLSLGDIESDEEDEDDANVVEDNGNKVSEQEVASPSATSEAADPVAAGVGGEITAANDDNESPSVVTDRSVGKVEDAVVSSSPLPSSTAVEDTEPTEDAKSDEVGNDGMSKPEDALKLVEELSFLSPPTNTLDETVKESAVTAQAAADGADNDSSKVTGFQQDLDKRLSSIDRDHQREIEGMGHGTGEEISRETTATPGKSGSSNKKKTSLPASSSFEESDSRSNNKTTDELLQEEIQERMNQVYTGHHKEIEAYGTGRGKTESQNTADDKDVVMRSHLVSALKSRLEKIYTGHIVELEAVEDGSGAYIVTLHNKPPATQTAESEAAAAAAAAATIAATPSQPLPSSTTAPAQEQVDTNVSAVATQPMGAPVTPDGDSDDNYEYGEEDDDDRSVGTVQSIATIQSMIISAAAKNTRAARRQQFYDDDDDDDDDYTEYTIESSMIPPAQRGNFQLPPHLQPPSMRMLQQQQQRQGGHQDESDDDDQWDEYTVETTRSQQIASFKRFSSSPIKNAPPGQIDLQQQPPQEPLHGQQMAHSQHQQEDDDDEEWEEYSVGTTRSQQIAQLKAFAKLPTPNVRSPAKQVQNQVASPRQELQHEQEEEDDEWDDYTIQSTRSQQIAQLKAFSVPTMVQSPPKAHQQQARPQEVQQDEEDEDWDEYTIQTTRSQQIAQLKAFSSFPPVNQRLQQVQRPQEEKPKQEDEEWEEYTVQTTRSQQIAQLRSSLPPSATKQPAVANPNRPLAVPTGDQVEHWDEFTIDTVADALLKLPQTLRTMQQQQQRPKPAAPAQPVSLDTYIINTHAPDIRQPEPDNDSGGGYGDGYDDDDNWDDFTVETVADAFLSLPRTVQLEFLRNTPIENCIPAQYDSDEEDGPPKDGPPPPVNNVEHESEQQEDKEVGSQADYRTCSGETVASSPAVSPSKKRNSVKLTVDVPAAGSWSGSFSKGGSSSTSKPLHTPATASLSSTKSEESETWHDTQTWHDPRQSASNNSLGGGGGASSVGTESFGDAHSSTSASTSTARRQRRSLPEMLQHDIFSEDTAVVESALEGLAANADGDKEYSTRIVQSGGLLKIVRAMEGNLEHATIQVLACGALEKIATDSEANQLAICEVGGVEAVVGSMERHMTTNTNVVEAACSALLVMTSNCTTNKMPIEVSVVDVIVKSMTTHSRHAIIQEKAFRTLASLCLEDKQKLVALSQVGGFVVMSAALAQHWDHPTVKNEAIQTLSMLFGRLAEHQVQ